MSTILYTLGHHKRKWEMTEGPPQQSVAGRIHTRGQFWRDSLHASKFVLNVIEQGYKLPFEQPCPSFLAKNNASSRQHPKFVTESIDKLLQQNCIREVSGPSFCCNPLTVATGKKLRLVLDLRHVNKFLQTFKFRYENLKTLVKIFEPGFFFATFDLKNGYHHIAIHHTDTKYLGFAWESNGRTRYYEFVVLPFGLAPASYIFTKMLRPLIKKWRGSGIRSIVYLDDGILGAPSRRKTAHDCLAVRADLEDAGFLLNEEKSALQPSQTGEWLGFDVNTKIVPYPFPFQK